MAERIAAKTALCHAEGMRRILRKSEEFSVKMPRRSCVFDELGYFNHVKSVRNKTVLVLSERLTRSNRHFCIGHLSRLAHSLS